MKNFVTTSWLSENINRDDLVILDVRSDLIDQEKGLRLYREGHIKGAQHVLLSKVMSGDLSKHGGRNPMPNIEKFIDNMKDLGVHSNSRVVIYDSGELSMAGRLWWLLKYIGKEEVYILEGGINKWIKDGLEITTKIATSERVESLLANIHDDMKADMEFVRESIGKRDTVIMDARSYERYIGKVEPLDRIAGHIPTALSLPSTDLIENGKINIEDLSRLLKPLSEYKEIILYCGSGIAATVPFIIMDEIGLKPRLYIGSFSDWISYKENEVAIGDET